MCKHTRILPRDITEKLPDVVAGVKLLIESIVAVSVLDVNVEVDERLHHVRLNIEGRKMRALDKKWCLGLVEPSGKFEMYCKEPTNSWHKKSLSSPGFTPAEQRNRINEWDLA